MALYEFEGKRPEIADNAFVHPEAVVIGGVRIGAGCYIGAGAVLRGDWGDIVVGPGSNIQENCVIHARPGETTHLGPNSHVGHGSIIHGVTLREHVLVGMGAVLHDGVTVGEGAVIGAGCVILEGTSIPAHKLVVGVPGHVVGDVTPEQDEFFWQGTRLYQGLAGRCLVGLRRLD
ncbi:MAG: gamma carbonic anhydrase family protein [Anaerolineae bacterium]